jgi:hypothetical protein
MRVGWVPDHGEREREGGRGRERERKGERGRERERGGERGRWFCYAKQNENSNVNYISLGVWTVKTN